MKTLRPILVSLAVALTSSLAAEPFTIVSCKHGDWSDPNSWQPPRVPKAGDKVHIRRDHRVEYDLKSDQLIPLIHVEGALVFARDTDTELNVAMLKVGGKMASHSNRTHRQTLCRRR